MFADGHLLTQLIPYFLLLKIKRCFENLVILLTWIRIRSIRIHITGYYHDILGLYRISGLFLVSGFICGISGWPDTGYPVEVFTKLQILLAMTTIFLVREKEKRKDSISLHLNKVYLSWISGRISGIRQNYPVQPQNISKQRLRTPSLNFSFLHIFRFID